MSSTRMTPRGAELAGLGIFVFCMYCAQRPDSPAQTISPSLTMTPPSPSPAPVAVVPIETSVTPIAAVAVAAPEKKSPRVVLHIGDSMVGYGHGLSRAMKKRFDAAGIEYHWDAWTSAQVQTVDKKKMERLLATFKPDLVLFNLGTNTLSVPHPEALADGIRALAARLAADGRECVWIAPIRPKWKFNPKMYDVLEENVGPCKYFDAGPVFDPPLQTDHIHPTDVGGEEWAAPLWDFITTKV